MRIHHFGAVITFDDQQSRAVKNVKTKNFKKKVIGILNVPGYVARKESQNPREIYFGIHYSFVEKSISEWSKDDDFENFRNSSFLVNVLVRKLASS